MSVFIHVLPYPGLQPLNGNLNIHEYLQVGLFASEMLDAYSSCFASTCFDSITAERSVRRM